MGWLRRLLSGLTRPSLEPVRPPDIELDLGVTRWTPKQTEHAGQVVAWVADLREVHGFRLIDASSSPGAVEHRLRLERNEDEPHWLRCRVDVSFQVTETQHDHRLYSGVEIVLDGAMSLDDDSDIPHLGYDGRSLEAADRALSRFLARLKS